MNNPLVIIVSIAAIILSIWLYKQFDKDYRAQKLLDEYLNGNLSPLEIGKFYERYIGHLYEVYGYHVEYHGAVKGFSDLGRDLIVKKSNEVIIVQTKCWSKKKTINEKYIFQLFGSLMHFKLTTKYDNKSVKAVFCTTANFSKKVKEVAKILGVELKKQKLDRSYPLIKCNVSANGEKIYHLPFDPYYDRVKIDAQKGEYFVYTVKEAVEKGFRRAKNFENTA